MVILKGVFDMRGRRKTVKISEAEWSIMKVLWDGFEKNSRGMTLGEIVQGICFNNAQRYFGIEL